MFTQCLCVSANVCSSRHYLWKAEGNFGCWSFTSTLCEAVFCCSHLHTPGSLPSSYWGFSHPIPAFRLSVGMQVLIHCFYMGSRNPNSSPLCHLPSPGPTSLILSAECPGNQSSGKYSAPSKSNSMLPSCYTLLSLHSTR